MKTTVPIVRRTAGPDAKRVTIEEYMTGRTKDGEILCYKCAQPGHIVPSPCVYYPYCIYCQGECRHSTRHHDERVSKDNVMNDGMKENIGE